MPSITPTPGRVMWFQPNKDDPLRHETDAPLAATVAFVHEDGTVNLTVHATNGDVHPRQYVPVRQDGDPDPGGSYACWMPYQLGQAAKTEGATSSGTVAASTPAAA